MIFLTKKRKKEEQNGRKNVCFEVQSLEKKMVVEQTGITLI